MLDGLGDLPVDEFGGKTPLEAADTPTFDNLAKSGITGLMHTISPGIIPGSDTAHLALFGYDPRKVYTGRGPFEAAGIGLNAHSGDIALRANFATINNGIIVDRRAGRIRERTHEIAALINDREIEGVKILFKEGTEHRGALLLRGEDLSPEISGNDPRKEGLLPEKIDAAIPEGEFTAQVLRKLVNQLSKDLPRLDINQERKAMGLPPANYILFRGAGVVPTLLPFTQIHGVDTATCVAGGGFYKGIARLAGMKVIESITGVTGGTNTNLSAKKDTAFSALDDNDFVFLHIKGADNLGHDGDFIGKKKFIERIDDAFSDLIELENIVISITGDHSTPCSIKDHSSDPTPVLISFNGIRCDEVSKFGERPVSRGGLGHIIGTDLSRLVMSFAGRSKKFGA